MGRRVAVLIGNQTFDESSKLKNLRGPANDVRMLSEVLADRDLGGFEVSTFIDEPSQKIIRHVGRVMKEADHDDTILLYYAGHGLLDDNGHLHLATSDTDDVLKASSIAAINLWHICSGGKLPNVILILDCCFAGAFIEGMRSDTNEVSLKQLPHAKGFHLLAGASPFSKALEHDRGEHGICGQFTSALTEGIRSGEADTDQDGNISLPELSNYLAKRLGGDKTRYEAHKSHGTPPIISRVRPTIPTVHLRMKRITGWFEEEAITPDQYMLLEDAIAGDVVPGENRALLALLDSPKARAINVVRFLESSVKTSSPTSTNPTTPLQSAYLPHSLQTGATHPAALGNALKPKVFLQQQPAKFPLPEASARLENTNWALLMLILACIGTLFLVALLVLFLMWANQNYRPKPSNSPVASTTAASSPEATTQQKPPMQSAEIEPASISGTQSAPPIPPPQPTPSPDAPSQSVPGPVEPPVDSGDPIIVNLDHLTGGSAPPPVDSPDVAVEPTQPVETN